MAPNGELFGGGGNPVSTRIAFTKPGKMFTANEGLQRAISDLSFQLNREPIDDMVEQRNLDQLPPISEVEEAKCECCGMCEECTPEYITRVRDKFLGRWICGLCSEAVKEEREKNGGKQREALDAHMNACVRFNRFGRTHPVLYQAEAMREMLRKSSRGARATSSSPRDHNKGVSSGKKTGIARSSSCIPAITKEIAERAAVN